MDRNRKILISILSLVVVSTVIAIVDISLKMQKIQSKPSLSVSMPSFGPGVGIVRVDGPITFSQQSGFGRTRGAEAVIRRLNELEYDDNIRAIVLRINSPGGTVGATQEIFQKLLRIREKNKTLVASMGEIAASGGYYIASACKTIVANHGTLTGSIGVIIAAPNIKGLFGKFGIKMNVIKSGRYKDIMSGYRDMTGDERLLIQQLINSSYKKFLRDVALGRSMNQMDIQKYADGRIFNGERALKYKLIDKIGTFEDAIDIARKKAKLPDNSPVYEERLSPWQQIMMGVENKLNMGSSVEKKLTENIHLIEYRYIP